MNKMRVMLSLLLLIGFGSLAAQYAQGLFFSEYVEGSSFNKAIEIYNGTGQDIDLTGYNIRAAFNGSTWHATNYLDMSGTIAHGQAYVVAHPQASAQILAVANVTSNVANHNGNDCIALFNGDTMIDVIGIYQNDPGQGWPVAGVVNATLDHTLIRKPTVISGTTDWALSAGTDAEDSQWIVHPVNYTDNLGSHTFTPAAGDMTATPTFNPPGGFYSAPISVSISCATDGANIYYTTDGSAPSASSTPYTTPIAISTATTLKAIAIAPDMDPSYVATANYSFPVVVPNLTALVNSPADGNTVYQVSGEVILTFQQPFRYQKFLQDSGAGILVDDLTNILATTYNIGDGITGLSGKISEYGDMLQLVPVAAGPPASSTNNPIIPIEVTFDNLYNSYNTYRSRVVKVLGVEFDNPSGNFANGTVYPIFDQDTEYDFRTTFYDVDYIGTPIPTTPKDIIGIPNSRVEGHYFSARWLSDFLDPAGSVSSPTFNPPAGTYLSPVNVSMSTQTPGAYIYYTTDGSNPSASSTLYTTPVQISQTTTLKAIAILAGADPSGITTAVYTFPTSVANLSSLRAAPLGGPYMVTGEVLMSFAQPYRNQKFVQDNTGAMLIDDLSGVITQTYQVGDGITGLVGTTMEFGGMFEFVPLINPGPPSSTGNPIIPDTITINIFLNAFNAWQSRVVTLQNVRFTAPEGNFANGAVYQIKDVISDEEANFRSTFFDVDYIGIPMQSWNMNITGIPNSRTDGIYFTPRNLADFQINEIIPPLYWQGEVLDYFTVKFDFGFETDNNLTLPAGFTGYRLYRNNQLIQTFPAQLNGSYTDELTVHGTYLYYMTAMYGTQESTGTSSFHHVTVSTDDPAIPASQTQLKGNYPNPFNPSTTITFSLKDAAHTTIEIFNTRGQKVRTLVDKVKSAGDHKILWDGLDDRGRQLSSGVYYYRMKSGAYSHTRKMLMLK